MSDAYIVEAVRTPVGRGREDGALHPVHPVDLLALTLAALLPAATASAATPEKLVDRSVNRMMNTTERAVESIFVAAEKGVTRIGNLDENDKPVRVMVRVSDNAHIKIEKSEIKGVRKINKIADKTIRILDRADADPAFTQIINGSRAHSIDAIREASRAAHTRVREALAAALEDEDLPDDGDGSE